MNKPTKSYRIFISILNLIISILLRIKVTGLDNFDHSKQYVIVGNHTGWADPIIIMTKLPKTYQIVILAEAASAYQQGFLQKLISWANLEIIGFDRSNQSSRLKGLRLIIKSVNEGNPLLVLPEGRINLDDNRLYPFYTGSFFASSITGTPILPVYIKGAQKIYFNRRIHINFGTPINVTKGDNVDAIAKKTYRHMLDTVQPIDPINNHKKTFLDLTHTFIGDMLPPPSDLTQIIADGREASTLFENVNAISKDKFIKK